MESSTQPKKTWDKVNSTYWWKMYLLPEHDIRKNANPDSPMIGYSQSEGWAECMNKHQLIKNKIINPHIKHNFIKKCSVIEIYKRRSFIIDTTQDVCIVELKKDDFIVHAENYGKESGDLIYWLKQLYNEILIGNKKDYVLTPSKKPDYKTNLDDKLNPEKYPYIRRNSDLQVLCTQLKSQGFSDENVLHFYRKFMYKLERQGITI